jgi:hypothetical protein
MRPLTIDDRGLSSHLAVLNPDSTRARTATGLPTLAGLTIGAGLTGSTHGVR